MKAFPLLVIGIRHPGGPAGLRRSCARTYFTCRLPGGVRGCAARGVPPDRTYLWL